MTKSSFYVTLSDDEDYFISSDGFVLGRAYYSPDGVLTSEDATLWRNDEEREQLLECVAQHNKGRDCDAGTSKTDNTQVIINMQKIIDEQQKQIDELKVRVGVITSAANNLRNAIDNYYHDESEFSNLYVTAVDVMDSQPPPPSLANRQESTTKANNKSKQGEE